jgi:hypothetical protein
MLSGLPNFAFAVGYSNASWTLKADLVAEYVCRLLNHMQANGYTQVIPRAPDLSEPRTPFLDLKSGYVERSIASFPKQVARAPWVLHQSYPRDVRMLRRGPVEDEAVEFRTGPTSPVADAPVPLAA